MVRHATTSQSTLPYAQLNHYDRGYKRRSVLGRVKKNKDSPDRDIGFHPPP